MRFGRTPDSSGMGVRVRAHYPLPPHHDNLPGNMRKVECTLPYAVYYDCTYDCIGQQIRLLRAGLSSANTWTNLDRASRSIWHLECEQAC